MPLFIGSDHAGYELKQELVAYLKSRGARVKDLTPRQVPGDDYPIVARALANTIASQKNNKGVLLCGTGIGMDIVANRVRGVRAALVSTVKEAKLSREHNDANILVMGGHVVKPALAKRMLSAWLLAKPSRAKRHVRRIKEIDA